MGIMSEEMKKVMERWSNEDSQPNEEIKVPTLTETPKKVSYRNQLFQLIKENPGATGIKLTELMSRRHKSQNGSTVSAQLKGLHKQCVVRRIPVQVEGINRHTFAYYALSEKETAELKAKEKRKLAQARARAERARQIKAQRLEERKHKLMNPNVITVSTTGPQLDLPLVYKDQTPDIRSMSAIDILNQLSFSQASALYKELKTAFGG
jgi:hypothetical protein